MSQFLRAGLLASAACFALTSASQAADFSGRYAPAQDYYAPPPTFFTWSGFYVGLNVGAGFASLDSGANQYFGNPAGVMGGLTVGYNLQVMPSLVLGVEGDVDGTSLGASNHLPFFGISGSSQIAFLSTIRGRIGYSMDRLLFYATAGVAFASVTASVNDWRALPFFGTQSSLQAGYALGGGVEYAITRSISAKAEFIYIGTASRDYFPATLAVSSFGSGISTVKAGLNYHF